MPEAERLDEKIYTTAEIELATGLPRGTITSRAKRLGFERNGVGYTEDQIFKIITGPLELHRMCEEHAIELREAMRIRIEKEQLPMAIVRNRKTKGWAIEYLARKKTEKEDGEAVNDD